MTQVDSDFYEDKALTIGERITIAREHAGLLPEDVAQRLAVEARTLGAWEAESTQPRANKLVMLAGILGVTPAWLLHGVDDGVSSPDEENLAPGDKALRTRLAKELREAVEIQERLQKRISRIADALANVEEYPEDKLLSINANVWINTDDPNAQKELIIATENFLEYLGYNVESNDV